MGKTYRFTSVFGSALGPLTQSAEYLPFKQRVAGSSPARPTTNAHKRPENQMRPHRLARSRTPAFHAGDRGSNPLGDATYIKAFSVFCWKLFYSWKYIGNNDTLHVSSWLSNTLTCLALGDNEILKFSHCIVTDFFINVTVVIERGVSFVAC